MSKFRIPVLVLLTVAVAAAVFPLMKVAYDELYFKPWYESLPPIQKSYADPKPFFATWYGFGTIAVWACLGFVWVFYSVVHAFKSRKRGKRRNEMRYLTVGYYVIVLNPLLSLLLLLVARARIGMLALVIGVQICGMILYLVGCRKTSKPSETPPLILLGGIFLIIWGFLIAWYIVAWYNFHITHYLPEKPLTFWDNMNLALYVLKGLLWVASGLMLIITRIFTTFRREKNLT